MRFTSPLLDVPYVAQLQQLTEYDEIVEVLRSKDFIQGAFEVSGPPFLHNSLLILDGKEHFERRRIGAQLFSKHAISHYKTNELEPMVQEALQRARTTTAEATGDVSVDLIPLTRQMLARVAASITGIDDITPGDRTDELLRYIDGFGHGITVEWATGDADAIIAKGLEARAKFEQDMFADSAARRKALVEQFHRGEIEREALPKDLITMLYLHWKDEWDDQLPLRETTAMMVGSLQTTAQALPHFMLHLDGWLRDNPQDRVLIDSDPAFLQSALYESLRLFVASPVRIRLAVRDVVLSTGRRVAEGERIGLLYRAANMTPEIFGEEPQSFNPHRTVTGSTPWGLSFGGGAHACLGRPMVTGVGSGDDVSDGTMAIIARELLRAGFRIDPDRPATSDSATFYEAFSSMPVLLTPHREIEMV